MAHAPRPSFLPDPIPRPPADLSDPADLARTVQWLRDRELISLLPQRYARGLDLRDFASSRALFRNDCTVKGSLLEAPIDEYWAGLCPGVEAYEATMHFMGNQFVAVEPGADTGHVETYAVAYHMEAAGNGHDDLVMGVRYCDDVARDGDDWKIVRRVAVPVWVRGPLPRLAD
ncbi:MAG: nuclear transport factor 2 family protein [Actinomycetes bacterium]